MQLQALPTAIVEPPVVGLAVDDTALLAAIAGFGRVAAPLAITAADITLESVWNSGPSDKSLCLRLSLGDRFKSQSADELIASLGLAATSISVDASLHRPKAEPLKLRANVTIDSAHRCIHASLPLAVAPSLSLLRSSVRIHAIAVAGKPVTGLPLTVPVYRGLQSPLLIITIISKHYILPCISPDGLVYVPPGDGRNVSVFHSTGKSLPGLLVNAFGLSTNVRWTAYVNGPIPLLLLADVDDASRLVAVEPVSRSIRWETPRGAFRSCGGIAALPEQGVVIVNSFGSETIYVLRLSEVMAPLSHPSSRHDWGSFWSLILRAE